MPFGSGSEKNSTPPITKTNKIYLVLCCGKYGDRLKSFEILQSKEFIIIDAQDTTQDIDKKVLAALPSSFHWNNVLQCLRVQSRPDQAQSDLKPILTTLDIAELLASSPKADLKLWVFGSWIGQIFNDVTRLPSRPHHSVGNSGIELVPYTKYNHHYFTQRKKFNSNSSQPKPRIIE